MNTIKLAVFSSKSYDISSIDRAIARFPDANITPTYFETRLTSDTAELTKGFDTICVFVNDELDAGVLTTLHANGIKNICLRCAGYNNVDLAHANQLGMSVARVPAYSPASVAEHTIALILALNRHIHKAYNRVKDGNFSLRGLVGSELRGKTVGVIGTGKIGLALVRILNGFGCNIICSDPIESEEVLSLGGNYCTMQEIFRQSDIITLHCPLFSETQHIINEESLNQMKDSVMLINTSRGGLIDTKAVIKALKNKKIGSLGLDVYEMESDLFFEDMSMEIIQDDVFQRLLTFPNVIITGHQGFFTEEALTEIAETTVMNVIAAANDEVIQQNSLINLSM